ncbi:hypothetical protein BJ944DRAFT_259466 [Cunninghamella echinulata]|nr:hypothetical protein BJ944DRAFT_259466 [Cunninghamella echinulata]
MKTLYSSPANGSCAFLKSTIYTKNKNDQQYTCEICQKSFNRPSALQTHSYIHTGEKPYQCTVYGCGRRFSVISNLRRHSKVHNRANLQRTRLSSYERHHYVQKLIDRTSLHKNIPLQPKVSTHDSPIHYHHQQPQSHSQTQQHNKNDSHTFPLLSIQWLINHE